MCRDGRVWKEGSLAADTFSSCLPLIKALERHSRAMYEADGVVRTPIPCSMPPCAEMFTQPPLGEWLPSTVPAL